ncbi:hypothetical protein [Achromobacter phage Motura]|uniref:Uncharacterized protein n=1 Tax=Achromobacter phage Motura TaxID=2591403 RepID=A0A514CT59_9CAUD|nr:hypothetical protein H1O15_gp079 [Achromobacter phage Motura]QDH83671.1 hypothetical protein [Achromobacter phage Motura]
MATYDFRSNKVGDLKIGIMLEWETQRIVVASTLNVNTQERILIVKAAKPEDREDVQRFINAASGEFTVKNNQKFLDTLAAYVDAKYTVKSKKNSIEFDSASKAQAFAKANGATITKIVVKANG